MEWPKGWKILLGCSSPEMATKMKTCPNCDGSGERNYAGDRRGEQRCRMCDGRGEILEPSDLRWVAMGMYEDGRWFASEKGPRESEKVYAFSLQEIMVLLTGARAVPGRLTEKALKERGIANLSQPSDFGWTDEDLF